MKEVLTTDIKEYPVFSRGKVRDVYDLDDRLLIVTTDRISAFDCIMPNGVAGRGALLTEISLFWFDFLKGVIGSHLVTANVDEYPADLHKYRDIISGRSMLVKKAKRIDLECIVRGYISGSMWKEYKKAREAGETTVHGHKFPADLKESDRLPEPIYTPSTKADSGHDENISYEQSANLVGEHTAMSLRDLSLKVYKTASDYALTKGIIIADTKFEFGFDGDRIILIDEVLTPDSSRFWPADQYQPGKGQPSFDKQIVRNYLDTLDWDKTDPAPPLPADVVDETLAKYQDVVARLTGK